jgi:hypothetical protein
MCVMCDLASAEGGTSRVFAAKTAPRRACRAKAKAQRGVVAAAMPKGVGSKGRLTLIKGGTILSMDQRVGNFATGDVLIDGSTIAEVAPSISAPGAVVIDAARRRYAAFSPTGSSSTTGGPKARTTTTSRSCRSCRSATALETSISTSFSPGSRRSTLA